MHEDYKIHIVILVCACIRLCKLWVQKFALLSILVRHSYNYVIIIVQLRQTYLIESTNYFILCIHAVAVSPKYKKLSEFSNKAEHKGRHVL